MISVQEVVQDPDMVAPQPYVILRSVGTFVQGGFQSVTSQIPCFGPVQQASNREIQMLPEADRAGSIRSFHATRPIYLTRGYAPVPSTHGEVPQGAVPGTTYSLSEAPPMQSGSLLLNGSLLVPNADYVVQGNVITLLNATEANDQLYFTWPVTANVQAGASDIIAYEGVEFRILQVYRDPGGGYWKGIGSRLNAA